MSGPLQPTSDPFLLLAEDALSPDEEHYVGAARAANTVRGCRSGGSGTYRVIASCEDPLRGSASTSYGNTVQHAPADNPAHCIQLNRTSSPYWQSPIICFNQTFSRQCGAVPAAVERNVDHLKRIIAVLASVAALLLPIGGAAAHASSRPAHTPVTQPNTDPLYTYGELLNFTTQKCAGLYGTSTADNAIFTEYPCGAAGFNDTWAAIANFSGSGGTWYQLQNTYSRKCAQPYNYSQTVGADVVQVTCTAPASSSSSCNNACSVQLWRFEAPYASGPGPFGNYQYLYNRYSNQCLNLKKGSQLDGTHISQTNCGSTHHTDIWILYPN